MGDMSYGEDIAGRGGGGGRSLVGGEGIGGRLSREEDAFRTTSPGRLDGERGESGLAALEVLGEWVKVTGDGEGHSGEEGEIDPDFLRRTCKGGVGLNIVVAMAGGR